MLAPALAALIVAAPPPAASTVAGRVTLGGLRPSGDAVWVTRGESCPRFIPDDRIATREDGSLRDAVVALFPEAGATQARARAMGEDLERRGARVEVQALRCGLEPRVQVARPGSLLVVREEPGTGHRLIAYRDGNPLSGGPLAAGRLRALDRPGTVDVRCASGHEWEVAWVHVTEAPFVAVSDADGRFAIPGVPRGRYTLRAWHPYLGKVEAPIEVEPAEPSGIVVAFSGRGIIDALYPGDAVEVP